MIPPAGAALFMLIVNCVLVMLVIHQVQDAAGVIVIWLMVGVMARPWVTVTDVAAWAMVAVPMFSNLKFPQQSINCSGDVGVPVIGVFRLPNRIPSNLTVVHPEFIFKPISELSILLLYV